MSRSLHLAPNRPQTTDWFWKALPFLTAGVVLALIWVERRNSRRTGAMLRTAPTPPPTSDEAAPATASEPDEAPRETASDTLPTPAEATTAIPQQEGDGWIRGDGTPICPPDFPIKGNATSRIYHLPGQASYEATVPAICFATEAIAAEHGFRPRKR